MHVDAFSYKSIIAYQCPSLPITAYHCLSLPITAYHCLPLPITAYHCLSLPIATYHCISLPIATYHCMVSIAYQYMPMIAYHCLSLPITAYHCLSLPINAYHCLSLPITIWLALLINICLWLPLNSSSSMPERTAAIHFTPHQSWYLHSHVQWRWQLSKQTMLHAFVLWQTMLVCGPKRAGNSWYQENWRLASWLQTRYSFERFNQYGKQYSSLHFYNTTFSMLLLEIRTIWIKRKLFV